MDNSFDVEVAKMRSLMERIEKPHTNYQAVLNEERLINEANGTKREVTRDEIIDILEDQDTKGNGGLYAHLVYATGEPLYKSKRAPYWRSDDVATMLGNTKDEYGEKAWHKDLSAYNEPSVKSSEKNPIAVVCVTKYEVHWTTKGNYDKAYGDYSEQLKNLRMSYGIGLDSDGTLGDNKNQRQNLGFGTQMNQNGNLSKDFNMASAKVLSRTFYRVDADGHIGEELPESAIKSMMALSKGPKPEKAVSDVISGEELEAYMEARAKLDAKFKGRTLNYDSMLAISANVNGVSYYYINDKLKLSGKNAIPVDESDMIRIGEEQIGQTFTPMDGFAQG